MRNPLNPIAVTGMLLLAASIQRSVAADELTAPKLFPESTVAVLRLPDAKLLGQRFNESAMGQMLQDEQVKPVIEQLYGSVTPALVEMQEQIGVSMDDLANLGVNEVAIGLVSVPAQRPAIALMVEMSEPKSLDDLLERAKTAIVEGGFTATDEEIEGVDAVVFNRSTGDLRQLVQIRLDDTLLVTSNLDVMRSMILAHKGDNEDPTLAENDAFRAIMTRCQGEHKSQLQWFVDPIGIARAVTRGNLGAAAGLALLPAIGLDGLLGAGGTMQMGDDDFDMVMRVHVLLDQPRDGVLEMVTLTNGEITPEPWVPADAASYTTWNWDVDRTYAKLTELFDSFRGDGALKRAVDQSVSEPLGADLEDEILAALSGRFSIVSWYERPITLTSQVNALGIGLKDRDAFEKTMAKIMEKFDAQISKRNFAGVTIYQLTPPEAAAEGSDDLDEEARRSQRRADRRRRRLEPVANMAIIGETLLLANRDAFLERAVMTQNGAEPPLNEELDYRLIASKLRRQPNGQQACMIAFERPDESLKVAYELLHSDEVRERINSMSENNPFFQAVEDALTNNRFPPFEVLAKYLAPSGGLLTNEESGFHYLSFSLRREPGEDEPGED